MKRRITVFTRETYERITLATAPRPTRGWCERCGAEVVMLTPEESALLARVSTRTIYRWAEAGNVHFAETPGGLLTVCREALAAWLASAPPQLTPGGN